VKILVVFNSKSGNTESMAFAVAKGAKMVGDVEVTVKKAEETKNSDLLCRRWHNFGVTDVFWANVLEAQSSH
jgi:flavodoxin